MQDRTAGIIEAIRAEPTLYQHRRDHGCHERDVPGCDPAGDEVEMDEELGRERCQRAVGNVTAPNYRNGYSQKTIKTQLGEIDIKIPEIARAITSRKSLESMTAMPKAWRTRSSPCTPAA